MKFDKLSLHLRQLKATLKPMDTRQRLEHLWLYYKWVLFVLAIVICIVSIVITGISNRNKELLLVGEVVNVPLSADGYNLLSEDYFAYLGGRPGKQEVRVSTSVYAGVETDKEIAFGYSASMRVLSMATGGELDYLITDEVGLRHYLGQDIFLDLREVLAEEELAGISDRIVNLAPQGEEGTAAQFPVAIDLTGTAFAENYLLEESTVYLSFVVNTQNMDACRNFLQYLLAAE